MSSRDNPCFLDKNEQIPAKIWELLRLNHAFRDIARRLRTLDAKARDPKSAYHGPAWERSCSLVKRVGERHPFAAVALPWLVPEPLFACRIAAWKRCEVVHLRVGEGLTPNVRDKSWVWRDPEKLDDTGHLIVRGPEVLWTQSKFKQLRDAANPIEEWRKYPWPFTVDHSWADAPLQFKREFQFIWRDQFDWRGVNPLTGNRTDSPSPHETMFFQDSGHLTEADLYLLSNELAKDYRVFAIPKTILTKGSADAAGKWLADELKKGSGLHGDLLKDKLLNESEMFGTTGEWKDWLAHQAGEKFTGGKTTHFYRRCRYMNSLVDRIFPGFAISDLLAPPPHRARGKTYVPKGGQK